MREPSHRRIANPRQGPRRWVDRFAGVVLVAATTACSADVATQRDAAAKPGTTPAAAPTWSSTPPPIDEVVNLGQAKQQRPYDDFVARSIADNEQWWTLTFPDLYEVAYTPLVGGVYASYPNRSDPVPGCNGEDQTTTAELATYVAFYCADGDFLAYDDSADSTLSDLTARYSPAVVAVVISHEWAHAIQKRTGVFARDLPTVYTEQHADCIAGAWVARTRHGESDLIRLSEQDVTDALQTIAEVRDPVGAGKFEPGAHGTAFDRAGAFQTGFTDGVAACGPLLEDPLPLTANEPSPNSDAADGGDIPFRCNDDADPECVPATDFFAADLNDYWQQRNPSFPAVKVDSEDHAICQDGVEVGDTVVACPSAATVDDRFDIAEQRHGDIGDFAAGYLYGVAWAEIALTIDNSPLVGTRRALARDCLMGQWAADISDDGNGGTRRSRAMLSAGDLDETLDMVLIVADGQRLGSSVDKIAAIRSGFYDQDCASYLT